MGSQAKGRSVVPAPLWPSRKNRNRFLNLPGVPMIEAPFRKWTPDNYRNPSFYVLSPKHENGTACFPVPNAPGCRSNCGSERRECRGGLAPPENSPRQKKNRPKQEPAEFEKIVGESAGTDRSI